MSNLDNLMKSEMLLVCWMTGNTSGPHVCYRFRKNGVEVDPFKQKLPEAKPINESLKRSTLVI